MLQLMKAVTATFLVVGTGNVAKIQKKLLNMVRGSGGIRVTKVSEVKFF